MKTVMVELELFEKGDRVHTHEGLATVLESERFPKDKYDIYSREVRVKLDEPTSRYTNGYATLDCEHFILVRDE